MANHLVTGGEGFVGSHLVDELILRGENVTIVDLQKNTGNSDKVKLITGSILDKNLMFDVLKNINVVHHLAASVPLAGEIHKMNHINFEGSQILFEAARAHQCSHFNFISTCAVYGKPQNGTCPINENTLRLPFENYGLSKLNAEIFLEQQMKKKYRMSISILRPLTVIGPGRIGIFEILFNWIQNDKTIFLIGDGANLFQLLHVKDLVSACLAASENNFNGSLNLGANQFSSLKSAIENLVSAKKSQSKIKYIPFPLANAVLSSLYILKLAPLSPWHFKTSHIDYFFDTSKAEKEINWRSQYSNDEMLSEAYDWFINNTSNQFASPHRRPLKRGLLSFIMK